MTDVVRGQIAYPELPMPANLYRGQDARDIAIYVAKCAGNANCGVTAEGSKPAAAGGTTGSPSGGSASGGAPQGAPKPNGKQVFLSAGCTGCHTLKDAGSHGTVGPNLDQLKPSKQVVAQQVTNGGGGMPPFKNQLSTAQIQAVAAYVSSVAGK